MDFLGKIVDSVRNFLFGSDERENIPTEETAATRNINPINFDITDKSLIDIPDDTRPPKDIQNMIKQLLNNFPSTQDDSIMDNVETYVTESIATIDFPDGDGRTQIKITEDMAGKTIEVIHEATTNVGAEIIHEATTNVARKLIHEASTKAARTKHQESPSSTIAYVFNDTLNRTSSSILQTKPTNDDTNYVNAYIIAGLVLLILIALCIGGIVWCKKNKCNIKVVNKNAGEYPVANQYLNNQVLTNTEKLKNLA